MKLSLFRAFCAVGLLGVLEVLADEENPNSIFVTSVSYGSICGGDRYAKCIPQDDRGTNGVTKIFRVGKEHDSLEHSYEWYSQQVYLSGGGDEKTSVVRFGPWNTGHKANTNDLALAFYYDGHLLKSYSTLDIAGQPDKVRYSVSHYEWCSEVRGYGYIISPSSPVLIYGFTLKTTAKRTLCFDVKTGFLVRDGKPEFER